MKAPSKLDQLRVMREKRCDNRIARRGYVTPEKPTCVYRYFSNEGALLYVGASVSPIARAEEHSSCAPWYRKIARIELQWFGTYPEAIDAERRAIKEESPRHNKVLYGAKPRPVTKPTKGKAALAQARAWAVWHVPEKANGRPKKHASAAAKQAAYRTRRKGNA